MKIELFRIPEWSDDKATVGELFIDGIFFSNTLEDTDRHLENYSKDEMCSHKIPKQTCIPRGTYEVTIDWSPHFNRNMPHIQNVPCFDGVRIHIGNRPEDTEGCLLVGIYDVHLRDFVSHSKETFDEFFADLLGAVSVGPVTIKIV